MRERERDGWEREREMVERERDGCEEKIEGKTIASCQSADEVLVKKRGRVGWAAFQSYDKREGSFESRDNRWSGHGERGSLYCQPQRGGSIKADF